MPEGTTELEPQHWLASDRTGNTQRWKDACEFNLLHARSDEYTEIEQRRDFYLWFYETTAAKGYQTRWALAAYVVASGMAEMASLDVMEGASPVTNEMQGLARIGNQVIFDDVLPKLRRLYLNGKVTGRLALQVDAAILAQEQQLIQTMYDSLQPSTLQRFQRIADNYYTRTWIGRGAGLGGSIASGPFHRAGDVPTFAGDDALVPGGDIAVPEDRWRYGMELASHFSTLPGYGSMSSMPSVDDRYTSGAEFDRLNVRPNLHQLDARLNDADVSESEVVRLLAALNPDVEQVELTWDERRLRRLGGALDSGEMRRAIVDLDRVALSEKLYLMARTESWDWDDLDYGDVQPLILGATREQRAELHDDEYWRDTFVDICTDDTIRQATVDLGLLPSWPRSGWTPSSSAGSGGLSGPVALGGQLNRAARPPSRCRRTGRRRPPARRRGRWRCGAGCGPACGTARCRRCRSPAGSGRRRRRRRRRGRSCRPRGTAWRDRRRTAWRTASVSAHE